VTRLPKVDEGRPRRSARRSVGIITQPDFRRLLTIASKHKLALAGGTAGFLLATPLSVIASLWVKTGLFPNRLELLVPTLRSPSPGLSLATLRAVEVLGGWEYEFTIREALQLLIPAVMFGLYLSVLVAILRSEKGHHVLFMRNGIKSRSGAAGGLLALVGNVLATGISLTPPCIGVVTTVSVLGLVGFGAGVAILPYVYLAGSLTMLVSLVLLVRKVAPDVTAEPSTTTPPRS
jgi:hypothetical protein